VVAQSEIALGSWECPDLDQRFVTRIADATPRGANRPRDASQFVAGTAGVLSLQVICGKCVLLDDHRAIFDWTKVGVGFGDRTSLSTGKV
jgi:hypothetical protein